MRYERSAQIGQTPSSTMDTRKRLKQTTAAGPSTRLRVLAAVGLFLVCLAAAGTLASGEMRKSLSGDAPPDDVPYLGITYISLSHDIAVRYGVGAESGLLVTAVTSGSPAALARLQHGDVILAVDSMSLTAGNTLVSLLAEKMPGGHAVLQVQRGAQLFTADLVLGTRSRT